jgi:hypothetical protein
MDVTLMRNVFISCSYLCSTWNDLPITERTNWAATSFLTVVIPDLSYPFGLIISKPSFPFRGRLTRNQLITTGASGRLLPKYRSPASMFGGHFCSCRAARFAALFLFIILASELYVSWDSLLRLSQAGILRL